MNAQDREHVNSVLKLIMTQDIELLEIGGVPITPRAFDAALRDAIKGYQVRLKAAQEVEDAQAADFYIGLLGEARKQHETFLRDMRKIAKGIARKHRETRQAASA